MHMLPPVYASKPRFGAFNFIPYPSEAKYPRTGFVVEWFNGAPEGATQKQKRQMDWMVQLNGKEIAQEVAPAIYMPETADKLIQTEAYRNEKLHNKLQQPLWRIYDNLKLRLGKPTDPPNSQTSALLWNAILLTHLHQKVANTLMWLYRSGVPTPERLAKLASSPHIRLKLLPDSTPAKIRVLFWEGPPYLSKRKWERMIRRIQKRESNTTQPF
ncbi:MAG: hypothetical protein SFZ03_06715 [Candidatus Melainabacteria bacterium]|nr:hypothetical protein [Candidatus Melainabacteria bacterium]